MTFAIHGLAVSRGIAIGRAVMVASSRVDVAHYFIQHDEVDAEIARVRAGRDAVVEEIARLQASISRMGPKEAPTELAALLDVHLMLLQDEELVSGVKHWITERLYNAEWALTTQLEIIARHFDEMEDAYLRERKADMEQICERVLRAMKGAQSPVVQPTQRGGRKGLSRTCCWTTLWTCHWCSLRTTCPRPTCCSSSKVYLPASSPTWAAKHRTPPSWHAAWTSPP